jgi:protein TonB
LSYADYDSGGSPYQRLRAKLGQRTTSLVAALLLEALLILVLLTLGQSAEPEKEPEETITSFDASAEPEAVPEPPQDEQPDPTAQPTSQPVEPVPTPPQQATPPPPAPVPLRRDFPSFDLSQLTPAPAPPQPKPPAYGPQGVGFPGDSKRVGTAPNGEPMYAAQWYREPDDTMLGNYLSTAQGPGWGLIACRTVPEYRVEDCVAIGEYPERSNISRSVLAAAWEFRVRPPRLRGSNMYGTWVRIRIDYTTRRKMPGE